MLIFPGIQIIGVLLILLVGWMFLRHANNNDPQRILRKYSGSRFTFRD